METWPKSYITTIDNHTQPLSGMDLCSSILNFRTENWLISIYLEFLLCRVIHIQVHPQTWLEIHHSSRACQWAFHNHNALTESGAWQSLRPPDYNALCQKSQTRSVNDSINMILTEYFWKFQWEMHCGNVVNMPYCSPTTGCFTAKD